MRSASTASIAIGRTFSKGGRDEFEFPTEMGKQRCEDRCVSMYARGSMREEMIKEIVKEQQKQNWVKRSKHGR